MPYSVGDTRLTGAETQIQPERLDPSTCQDIVNLLWDGGSVTTRPGMVGQLTSALGGAIYFDRCRYVKADGSILLPFASGGKLYYLTTGGTSATEIVNPGPTSFSFTNNGRDVRLTTVGKWLYILDGGDSSGVLYRVNLESGSTAESAAGLAAPTVAPTATKYDTALISDLTAVTGTWSFDTLSSGYNSNMASNAWFDGGGATGSDVGDYWKTYGSPCCYTSGGVAALPTLSGTNTWLLLDDPDDRVLLCANAAATTLYITNPTASNSSWAEGSSALTRYATRYDLSFDLIQLDPGTLPVVAKIQWFDTAPTSDIDTPLIELNYEFSATVRSKAERKTQRIDITDRITGGDPKYVRVYLCGAIDAGGTNGPYITNVNFTPIYPEFAQTASTSYATGIGLYLKSYCANDNLTGFLGVFTPTTAFNLSGFASLNLNMATKGQWSAMPTFRLRFKNGTKIWVSTNYTLGTTVSVDISDMPEEIKTNITAFAFELTSDATIISTPSGRVSTPGHGPLYLISLSRGGGLSAGNNYAYLYTFMDASGTAYTDGGIESAGSPYSAIVSMEGGGTRIKLEIARSGYPSGADYLAIWRLGSSVSDGDTRPRLVAFVPTTADATSPAATTQADPTNEWYWDYNTTGSLSTFYDSVPDDNLESAPVYQLGRDVAPTGATAMIEHAGRLWLARYDSTRKVNEVYASWLMDAANDYPYFTNSPDDDDPEVSTKGTLLGVGGQGSGDRVIGFGKASLEPTGGNIGSSLMVMRQSAPPAIIDGWRSGQALSGAFRLWPSAVEQGGGCLSAQGVEMVNGQALYLGATGIVSTMGTQLSYQSRAMEERLSLAVLGKTRYSKVFLLWHDRRLWCFVIGSGSTDGEALVWDERSEGSGWSRISGIAGWTSGISLSGGEDTGDLYLGGRDGQIYKLAGTVASPTATSDKATPSGSAVSIAYSLTTRRHGQAEAEGVARYSLSYPHRLFVDAYYGGTAGTTTALSWTIRNEYGTTTGGSGYEQNLPAGRIVRTEITEVGDVRGKVHEVLLSGSVTKSLTLHSYLMLDARGGAVR